MDGVNGQFGQGQGFPGGGFGGQPGGDFFGDFFNSQGGFGGFGSQQRRTQKLKSEPILREVIVDLQDIYEGSQIKINFTKNQVCTPCSGKGGMKVNTCFNCNGSGFVIKSQNLGGMMMQSQEICSSCHGQGEVSLSLIF